MLSVTANGIEYKFFSPSYAVSKCGKILRRLVPFAPRVRPDGYLDVGSGGLVHRMVAFCWLEKPLHSHHVHHKDHDRSNNHADNLEWITPQEHMRERHAHHGPRYRMTEDIRQKIRTARIGFKDTPETREKKKSILLRIIKRKLTCEINGIRYRSFLNASKVLGLHFHTVRYRCLSKNFLNYQLVTDTN